MTLPPAEPLLVQRALAAVHGMPAPDAVAALATAISFVLANHVPLAERPALVGRMAARVVSEAALLNSPGLGMRQ